MTQGQAKREAGIPRGPVCGIGALAGGGEALQALFKELIDDLGLAYVVNVHLAPEHRSLLSDILNESTGMDVVQAEASPSSSSPIASM